MDIITMLGNDLLVVKRTGMSSEYDETGQFLEVGLKIKTLRRLL